jgi:DNA-binding MarR family transcriptional regulator/GNAT superfamily N-acetyltransferase
MPTKPTTESALAMDSANFRRFNRMYTRLIGTLNEGLLGSEFGLAEARVLYELATSKGNTAKGISEQLGLDAGYLSRLLGKFERDGLLQKKASALDGRSTDLRLTARGRAAFKTLNARSDEQARSFLEVLPHASRMKLVRCMQSIEIILTNKTQEPRAFILRPHRVGDMGWIVHREGQGYAEQYGWDGSFEALVARIVADFVMNFDAARERCWIADVDGQHAGHIFLVCHPEEPGTAKLRLLFVEPSARGMGLGEALVSECVRFARSAGYDKVVLWTQSLLTAAHRIYAKAGFLLIKEEPHYSFGHDLVGQEWKLKLK